MLTEPVLRSLIRWEQESAEPKSELFSRTEECRACLLRAIQEERDLLLQRSALALPRAHSAALDPVREYAHDSDWALLDAIALASCSDVPTAVLARDMAGRSLLFQAIRMLDDGLDEHESYKGAYPTALNRLRSRFDDGHGTSLHWLLVAMTLCAGASSTDPRGTAHALRTLGGMIGELFLAESSGEEDYEGMAEGKMVQYGLLVYEPVIDLFAGPRLALDDFVRRSLHLGQIANDLHDVEDDRKRGQLNYWSLPRAAPADPGEGVLQRMRELAERGSRLPEPLDRYAAARVGDLARYMLEAAS